MSPTTGVYSSRCIRANNSASVLHSILAIAAADLTARAGKAVRSAPSAMSSNQTLEYESTLPRAGTFRGVRWWICGLLFFATTINYIDRGVIGVLKPTLQKELGWSEIDYSNIVFWFQVAYA